MRVDERPKYHPRHGWECMNLLGRNMKYPQVANGFKGVEGPQLGCHFFWTKRRVHNRCGDFESIGEGYLNEEKLFADQNQWKKWLPGKR